MANEYLGQLSKPISATVKIRQRVKDNTDKTYLFCETYDNNILLIDEDTFVASDFDFSDCCDIVGQVRRQSMTATGQKQTFVKNARIEQNYGTPENPK